MSKSLSAPVFAFSTALGVAALPAVGFAADQAFVFLSDQGYSGYTNTPSAYVTPEGQLSLLWSDAIPSADTRDYQLYDQADNYLVSVGLFPRLEFSGRLTNSGQKGFGANSNTFTAEADGERDLSTNAKLSLWAPRSGPNVAVGLQDASGNGHFTASYGVVSHRLAGWEGSVGYSTGRMDGLFYGVRRNIGRFASISYDDDTVQRVASLDLQSGNLIPGLTLVGRYRFFNQGVNAEPGISLGAVLELDSSKRWRGIGVSEREFSVNRAQSQSRISRLALRGENDGCEAALQREAEKAGLERVSIQQTDEVGKRRFFLATDARRYPYSPADAPGVAMGLVVSVCQPAPDTEVTVQIADDGAPKFWVQARAEEVGAYYNDAAPVPPQLAFGLGAHPEYEGLGRRAGAEVDVQLGPELRYTVATELGVLDYSAGIRTRVSVPLWWGASFDAMGIDTVGKTDDFERGEAFSRSALKSEWVSRSLQQTVPLWGYGVVRAHFGRNAIFDRDRDMRIGELVLFPLPQTGLQLETRYSEYKLRPREIDQLYQPPEDEYTAWTGSVRYMFGSSGTLLDLTWGRHHYGDEGARLRLERFFGDTGIAMLYIRDRESENEALSVQVSIPFGMRRTYDLGQVAVGSNPAWFTGLTTIINAEANFLRPNLLREVLPTDTLGRQYLNRYRLSRTYLQASWPRMRNAFESYVSYD